MSSAAPCKLATPHSAPTHTFPPAHLQRPKSPRLTRPWRWLVAIAESSLRTSSHLACAQALRTQISLPDLQLRQTQIHKMDQRPSRPLIHNPNHQSSLQGPPPAQPTVYQPPSSQQPPVQIPFSDPFSQRRAPDPFLPSAQPQRRGSYGLQSGREAATGIQADRNPLGAPWPPTSGTYTFFTSYTRPLAFIIRSFLFFSPCYLPFGGDFHGFKRCFPAKATPRLVATADVARQSAESRC